MMASRLWDYEFVFANSHSQGALLGVTEGQVLLIDWDCQNEFVNANGWILNGNGCCDNISQVRQVGRTGQRTITVTASGTVRIGAYSANRTFAVQYGTIRIRIM